jgi:ribonuclease VapC
MVIDTSALMAILLNESDRFLYLSKLMEDSRPVMSAVTVVEAGIVMESRKGDAGARELELLIFQAGIQVVAVDAEQSHLALAAWRRFGKGRHKASLNLGDCFAYALAKKITQPLLAKGQDFPLTDIELAG